MLGAPTRKRRGGQGKGETWLFRKTKGEVTQQMKPPANAATAHSRSLLYGTAFVAKMIILAAAVTYNV